MKNDEIENIENQVIALDSELRILAKQLPTRTEENYNHLGTLDCNLKMLQRSINIIIKQLGYRQ